jgi:hypothetical protein
MRNCVHRGFVILKVLAIAVAWSVVAWWFSVAPAGRLSVVEVIVNGSLAVLLGSLYSAIILLLRRDNFARAARTGLITLSWTFLFATVGGFWLLEAYYGYDHGYAETERCMFVAGLAGAVFGGLLSQINEAVRRVAQQRATREMVKPG